MSAAQAIGTALTLGASVVWIVCVVLLFNGVDAWTALLVSGVAAIVGGFMQGGEID